MLKYGWFHPVFQKSQTIRYLTHHSQRLWQRVHLVELCSSQNISHRHFFSKLFHCSSKTSYTYQHDNIIFRGKPPTFSYIKRFYFSFHTEMTFTLLLQIMTSCKIRKNENRMIQVFLAIWRFFFFWKLFLTYFLAPEWKWIPKQKVFLKLAHMCDDNWLLCHTSISKWYPIVKGFQDYSIISGLIVSKSSY